MNWSTHPRPETRPVTVREALAGVPQATTEELAEIDIRRYAIYSAWARTVPGDNDEKRFSLFRLHPDRVCPTVVKVGGLGSAAATHWSEPRYLTRAELRRVFSFPDDFKLVGKFRDVSARLGNSVPPLLMRSVAANLALAPFMKTTTRRRPSASASRMNAPTVISLFAGCGGSSLGYKLAGYRELLAVEWDDNAAETFRLNFPGVPLYHGDIARLTVKEAMRMAGLSGPRELDVLDGSPPCQGFSLAGDRRLEDPRNALFREYCRLLRGLQPKMLVMENVTGLVKGHMRQIYLAIVEELRSYGYRVQGEIMNAMYYGVPQARERVIIVGVRKDLKW